MKPSGGRAFPKSDTSFGAELLYREEGMTLREYYAGQVISSCILISKTLTLKQMVEKSFEIADMMIEEGNK